VTFYEACDVQQPGTGFRCTREKGHIPHGYAGVFWDDPSDTKALVETASKLGFELGKAEGRRQAGEEIAAAIEGAVLDLDQWPGEFYREAAQIARNIASQPQGGASEPLTAPTPSPRTPEGSEALSIRIPGGEG
jgi:hypothetical protein